MIFTFRAINVNQSVSGAILTHIKIVFLGIVHNFNKFDHVWMIQFLENGNFSVDLK